MTGAAARWPRGKRLVGLMVFLAGQFAFAAGTISPANSPDSGLLFAAALIDLDSQAVTLAKYRGKPLIVNFWARWCGPCKVEIPELVSLQKRNTGVELLGLNVENNAPTVRDFAFAYDVNYPVFLTKEPGLALMQALGNSKSVLPFTVVIDRHGTIVSTHVGAMTREKLDAAVQLALKSVLDPKQSP
ncbi:MAG: redoxin family protein [Burkholderiales bacterium]